MTVSRPLPKLGERIAGYSVIKKVGEGNRGVVYQARDPLGESVALKILKPECSQDPDLVREFLDEAQATDRIHHEAVVKVLGGGESDGSSFRSSVDAMETDKARRPRTARGSSRSPIKKTSGPPAAR